jgi:hypothetical protein
MLKAVRAGIKSDRRLAAEKRELDPEQETEEQEQTMTGM